jgi:hypothetical protein
MMRVFTVGRPVVNTDEMIGRYAGRCEYSGKLSCPVVFTDDTYEDRRRTESGDIRRDVRSSAGGETRILQPHDLEPELQAKYVTHRPTSNDRE